MPCRRLLPLALLAILFAGAAVAQTQQFGANEHQSKWSVNSSPLVCSLSQDIPAYGTATFTRHAGRPMEFTLRLERQPLRAGSAALVAEPPAWLHGTAPRPMGQVALQMVRVALRVHTVRARRMLQELEVGLFPTFIYADPVDRQDQVRVALSAVNFHNAFNKFSKCLGEILPHDFQQIRYSRLYFRSGKADLTPAAKARLDDVAEYVLADDSVTAIGVRGYTDSHGWRYYNRLLSRRRAKAVKAYLVAKGVSAKKFTLHGYGERHPIRSNRTAKGRAANRRVVVMLSR